MTNVTFTEGDIHLLMYGKFLWQQVTELQNAIVFLKRHKKNNFRFWNNTDLIDNIINHLEYKYCCIQDEIDWATYE